MILSNSFFGFDEPSHLEPNTVMAGPIMNPDVSQQAAKLKDGFAELGKWMDDAAAAKEDIVFISFGNLVHWQ